MMVGMAVSAAYGLNEQRKAANRSERFYRKSQAEQAKQIHYSKSVEAQDRAQRARAERAKMRAQAAESGLTGITTTDLLDNVLFQSGQDVARIEASERFAQTDSLFQLQSNLNSIQQPDYIGTALNTGLQMYGIKNKI